MNQTEIARLAAAVNLIRPDWPTASLQTFLVQHLHRPLRDVAVALVWVATDRDTKTPARLNEAGPWWSAATTSDVPQAENDCRVHTYARVRTDQKTGRSVCGGCWTDENEPTELLPLRRAGSPIPEEARAVMTEALTRPHEIRPNKRGPLPPSEARESARAELEAARKAALSHTTGATG